VTYGDDHIPFVPAAFNSLTFMKSLKATSKKAERGVNLTSRKISRSVLEELIFQHCQPKTKFAVLPWRSPALQRTVRFLKEYPVREYSIFI